MAQIAFPCGGGGERVRCTKPCPPGSVLRWRALQQGHGIASHCPAHRLVPLLD